MPSLDRTIARALVVGLCTLGLPIPAALERQGVSADSAKARVDALSDDEVEQVAARFDSLPAAGSGLETALVIGFLVFVTLLITDILGFTKVFSFTRPAK